MFLVNFNIQIAYSYTQIYTFNQHLITFYIDIYLFNYGMTFYICMFNYRDCDVFSDIFIGQCRFSNFELNQFIYLHQLYLPFNVYTHIKYTHKHTCTRSHYVIAIIIKFSHLHDMTRHTL